MDGDIEDEVAFPVCVLAKYIVDENQMAAGTDRKEFCEALNKSQNDQGKKYHVYRLNLIFDRYKAKYWA
jgi:hypothetical protein